MNFKKTFSLVAAIAICGASFVTAASAEETVAETTTAAVTETQAVETTSAEETTTAAETTTVEETTTSATTTEAVKETTAVDTTTAETTTEAATETTANTNKIKFGKKYTSAYSDESGEKTYLTFVMNSDGTSKLSETDKNGKSLGVITFKTSTYENGVYALSDGTLTGTEDGEDVTGVTATITVLANGNIDIDLAGEVLNFKPEVNKESKTEESPKTGAAGISAALATGLLALTAAAATKKRK